MGRTVVRIAGIAALVGSLLGGGLAAAGMARAATRPPTRDSLGTLVIVVRDAATRRPIPLVTVLDTDRLTGAITDPHGIAELHGLAAGKVRLRIYNEHYYPRTSAAVIHTGGPDTLRLTMRPDHRQRPKEPTIMVKIGRPAWAW